jgi:adenylate kinase
MDLLYATRRKMMEMQKSGRNIILFGPPGVGKGAQAQILSQTYHLKHLSTGDVIRDEIAKGTDLGLRVKEAVNRGEFADDETVLGIVMSRIDTPEYQNGFVMDGFPRTIRQAELFDQLLANRGKKVDFALFFSAPEETVLRRLAGRRICSSCGATYHEEFRRPRIPGVCDSCKGKVVKRHDDEPTTHRDRLRAYVQKTLPLAEYYRRKGVLVDINGDQSVESVAEQIQRTIQNR